MSEKIPQHNSERHHAPHEALELSKAKQVERETKNHEVKNEHAETLEAIRRSIDKQAISKEKTTTEKEAKPSVVHVTKELKEIKYKETMYYVRRHLKPSERKLSTFIHIPSVEKVSEVSAKTVARPSGLLGGGILALIGSLLMLYIARHIGFVVPNSLFMILFVLGFIAGLLVEAGYKTLTIKRRRMSAYKNI